MRSSAAFGGLLLLAVGFGGCIGSDAPVAPQSSVSDLIQDPLVIVHDALGRVPALSDALPGVSGLAGKLYSVGQPGAEPSIGVASDGTLYFQASHLTVRSKDHGRTWQILRGPLLAIGTSDPYLWVDPETDRVFQINQGLPFGGRGVIRLDRPGLPPESPVTYTSVANALFCSHIAWSDDGGASWLANPVDCGPVPGVDHIKLATGPWVGDLSSLSGSPAYPNAVYFAHNKAHATGVGVRGQHTQPDDAIPSLGGWMTVSFDGGATFPYTSQMFPPTCTGGLHGNIAVASDGAVYVPARACPAPIVAYSYDNGRTWGNVLVGDSVGVPEQHKNPEMAVDSAGNVYLSWVGADNRLYLSMSRDRAATWSEPIVASPPSVGSAIFPVMVAGDEGRIGIAYLGTGDSTKGAWEVGNETEWHVYYTFSLDALSQNPTFVTLRGTPESNPVQRGTICVSSDKCEPGSANRNLLDFIDMALDAQGRPYIAYADGCTTPQCLGEDGKPTDSRDSEGMVFLLESGPSLYADGGDLAPFAES